MKKRLAMMLACVVLAATMLSLSPAALGNGVTLTVESKTVAAGDTVEVAVSVSDDHYLVNGRIFVEYDPTVLELQTVSDDEDNLYLKDVNTDILDHSYMWIAKSPQAGSVRMVFLTSSSKGAAVGGTLFRLVFKVLHADVPTAEVTVSVPEMCANDGTTNGGEDYDADLTTVNGTLTLEAASVKKGDVNLDGEIALADAMQAFYHVNEKIVLEGDSFKAADLDDDGTVTIGEAMKIFYYVNEKITEL